MSFSTKFTQIVLGLFVGLLLFPAIRLSWGGEIAGGEVEVRKIGEANNRRVIKQANGELTPESHAVLEKMIEKAEKQGSITVSVAMSGNYALEHLISREHVDKEVAREKIESQRREFSDRREVLIQRMESNPNIKQLKIRRSGLGWFFGISTDANGLRELAAAPEVKSFSEPLEMKPVLNVTTEQIGSKAVNGLGHTGNNEVVVIIDSGMDFGHPMLTGKKVGEACVSKNTGGRSLLAQGIDKLTRRRGLALLDGDCSALYVDVSAHSERVLR